MYSQSYEKMRLFFCRTGVDLGALVDRLDTVHDDLVTYIDSGSYHDISSDGLSKLYLFLEGAQFRRFHGVGAFGLIIAFFTRGISRSPGSQNRIPGHEQEILAHLLDHCP